MPFTRRLPGRPLKRRGRGTRERTLRVPRLPDASTSALSRRVSRLASIFSALDQGIAFIHPDGAVAEINDRYLSWLGVSREEAPGLGLEALGLETEDYQVSVFLDLFRRGAAHAPVSFGLRLGERDATVKLQPVNEGGVFCGLMVSLIDVTPLVEARLSVEREKNFLEQVITIAGAAICIVNRDDVVVTINDEFTAITGYGRDEAMGRRRDELLRESCPTQGDAGDAGDAVQKHQCQILTSDNRRLTILKNAAPILDADGNRTGGIESFVDVSDIIRASQEAEEASRLKSVFLANMSHEIRTPLNAIMGLSQFLLATELTPEQQECAGTIRSAGEGLLVILNDILDFSRIELGHLDIRPVSVDLDRLLGEVRRLMDPAARDGGLILALERDPRLPRLVFCDPVRLKQILLNLLSNAVKFTADGRVCLSVTNAAPNRDDDAVVVRFEVKDTGPGIAPEEMERIFEPFVQADAAIARNYGGTGLGLSISNRLVRLMGGTGLEVTSQLDRGSAFSFVLSFAEPQAQPDAEGTGPTLAPAEDFGGLRVLVAEDNAFNRFLLQKIMAKLGVGHTAFADNGQKALDMILTASRTTEPYHVVFMDLRMPVLDGVEVTRRVRAQGIATPIVALTAQTAEDGAQQCREAGMSGFFSKPYRINDLEAVLMRLADEAAKEEPS